MLLKRNNPDSMFSKSSHVSAINNTVSSTFLTGSPFRDLISDAILKLQEDQNLQMLYNKWWKEKGGAGQCIPDDKNKKDANALAIANVGGVFVVLVAGLVLSLVVSILEFIWKSHRSRDPDKVFPLIFPLRSFTVFHSSVLIILE